MLLSRTAIYALRALSLLAEAPAGERLTAAALSEACSVPRHYVQKVLRPMVDAGIVDAARGQGGGFRLSRPPHEIRFGEVLEAVRLDLEPGQCVFRPGACRTRAPCIMHDAWSDLLQRVTAWAQETTLASRGRGAAGGR